MNVDAMIMAVANVTWSPLTISQVHLQLWSHGFYPQVMDNSGAYTLICSHGTVLQATLPAGETVR